MATMMERLKIVNSTVRTGIAACVLGGVGYGGWLGYDQLVRPGFEATQAKADLEELREEFEFQRQLLTKTNAEKEKLALSLKLIKLDRRMAEIKVLDKGIGDDEVPFLDVRFTEVDENGNVIGAEREYTLHGEQFFIDSWVVSFQDKYIEGGDELRGTALCVFKGIYGEVDGPLNAMSLDPQTSGPPPGIYKSDEQNAFEEKIWSDFWSVCNDEEKQQAMGIEAAHGQANYIKAEKGKTYRFILHAAGGATIDPAK